jgi:hypothetical protein
LVVPGAEANSCNALPAPPVNGSSVCAGQKFTLNIPSSRPPCPSHTHTRAHSHTHERTHARKQASTHARTHARTHTQTYTHIPQTHTHKHTLTNVYTEMSSMDAGGRTRNRGAWFRAVERRRREARHVKRRDCCVTCLCLTCLASRCKVPLRKAC